jgi:hypothetical protein
MEGLDAPVTADPGGQIGGAGWWVARLVISDGVPLATAEGPDAADDAQGLAGVRRSGPVRPVAR